MKFKPSFKIPRFRRKGKGAKLEQAPTLAHEKAEAQKAAEPKPRKAKRHRPPLMRAMRGIQPWRFTISARVKRRHRNLSSAGWLEREASGTQYSEPRRVRRARGEEMATPDSVRSRPKCSQSKYMPWVEDAKHSKRREKGAETVPHIAADGMVTQEEAEAA